jgi:hypothetical protein
MERKSFFCDMPANYCFGCGVCHMSHQNTLCALSTVFNGPLTDRVIAVQRLNKYLRQAVEMLEEWSAKAPDNEDTTILRHETEKLLNGVY